MLDNSKERSSTGQDQCRAQRSTKSSELSDNREDQCVWQRQRSPTTDELDNGAQRAELTLTMERINVLDDNGLSYHKHSYILLQTKNWVGRGMCVLFDLCMKKFDSYVKCEKFRVRSKKLTVAFTSPDTPLTTHRGVMEVLLFCITQIWVT